MMKLDATARVCARVSMGIDVTNVKLYVPDVFYSAHADEIPAELLFCCQRLSQVFFQSNRLSDLDVAMT